MYLQYFALVHLEFLHLPLVSLPHAPLEFDTSRELHDKWLLQVHLKQVLKSLTLIIFFYSLFFPYHFQYTVRRRVKFSTLLLLYDTNVQLYASKLEVQQVLELGQQVLQRLKILQNLYLAMFS